MTISVKITDPLGYRFDYSVNFKRLHFASALNRVGYFEIEFDASNYPRGLWGLDRRAEIFYKPQGRAERILFVGYMRLYEELSAGHTYIEDYREEKNVVFVGGKGRFHGWFHSSIISIL